MIKYLIISFFLVSGVCFSQTYLQESNIDNSVSLKTAVNKSILSQIENSQSKVASNSSSVFIQQIGNFNNVTSVTQSTTGTTYISQTGNFNLISQNIRSKTIESTLTQKGNNNEIIAVGTQDYNLYKSNIVQQGQDLSIKMYGSNSISEKMKIKMTGTSKTILVRNY